LIILFVVKTLEFLLEKRNQVCVKDYVFSDPKLIMAKLKSYAR
jgi:hypothetical protein